MVRPNSETGKRMFATTFITDNSSVSEFLGWRGVAGVSADFHRNGIICLKIDWLSRPLTKYWSNLQKFNLRFC